MVQLRRSTLAALLVVALSGGVVVATSSPAVADESDTIVNGGETDEGYNALAGVIQYSGNATGGGGASTVSGPAPFMPCRWRGTPAEYRDNSALADWAQGYERDGRVADYIDGSTYMGAFPGARVPSTEEFEAHRNDNTGGWYVRSCSPPTNGQLTDEEYAAIRNDFQDLDQMFILWVPDGTPPPPPPVTADMLRWFAERELTLRAPAMARSPQTKGVVQLPTWFWTTDRTTLWVTATVGGVWARVEAAPTRITVRATGPESASIECPDLGAAYRAGADADGSSCSLTLRRSGLYDYSATTAYAANWDGSDGTTNAPLPDKIGPAWQDPDVEVVEVQTVGGRN